MLARAPTAAPTLADAVWIDLLSATDVERAEVETATGLRLPTKDEIEEIETTSRVYMEDGALYVSTPLLAGNDCAKDTLTALGCVLTPTRLVTIRFADFAVFKELTQAYGRLKAPSAGDAFLRLLEIVVDHTADALERAGAELEDVSHSAFRGEERRRQHARQSADLRTALRKLGRMSDGVSHLRDSLLGLGRIAAFVHETAGEVELKLAPARLNAIRVDLASLNDYQAHLAGKIQFLLDATLGFISIQQNEIVKTLTIVSVVGVPPVLIAGVYGMNFRFMPELNWPLGYPFALGLIVLSGIIPLVWLKWRGWM
jgi:magnesium transporter